jgi:hypothetical protein
LFISDFKSDEHSSMIVRLFLEQECIDDRHISIVVVHPLGKEGAIGKSVTGNTTKTHRVVDSCGLPIHFLVTGGKVTSKFVAELAKA